MRFFASFRMTTAYNARVTGTFEHFDHTADMGIRARAGTQAGLVEPAVAGLYAAIGELRADRGRAKQFHFQARGGDDAILLRDFLTELLVLFERDQEMVVELEAVEFGAGQISVNGKTAPVDPEHSVLCREVKAITYHDLAIQVTQNGCEATLIVDI